jgi:hypothetical protein
MPTIFEDNFNSYNDGNLEGQGGWTHYDVYTDHSQVQGIVVKEGAKAIKNSYAGDQVLVHSGNALKDGRITFYFRTINHSGWYSGRDFQFRCTYGAWGAPTIIVGVYQDGYIKLYNGATGQFVNIQTYNDDQWYCVEIEWRSSPDYKYRVRINGGTWTDWYAGLGGNWTNGLNYIGFNFDFRNCTGDFGTYFDYIAEYPYVPPAGRSYGYIF